MIHRTLAAALLTLVATGCTALTGTDEAYGERALVNGIELGIASAPTRADAGAPIHMKATITNHNAFAVRIDFSSGCIVLPYVETAAGEEVVPGEGGWFCTAALSEVELAAGERVERSVTIPPLAAGSYRAHVRLLGTAAGARLALRSPSVAIRVE